MKVVVCICTFRRPDGLQHLLEQLAGLDTEHAVSVVVADNDQQSQQGLSVIAALDNYRWPIEGILVTTPGISYARNGALSAALSLQPDLIACLDDDEWPSSKWLDELIRVQQQYQADLVGGPTKSVFPAEATDAQRNNPYYGAELSVADGSLCQLQAAGNFLIRPDVLSDMAPDFFHPEFALSGGEDLAFFTALAQQQRQMRWASKAVVHESVPAERLSDSWLRQRVINIANSRVFVMQSLEPGLPAAAIRVIKTVGLGLVALGVSVSGLLSQRLASKGALLRWKFTGKLMAHLNQRTVRSEAKTAQIVHDINT